VDLLLRYDWPGNVRELAAVIERAAILGNGRHLELRAALGTAVADPAQSSAPHVESLSLQNFPSLDQAMSRHIQAALALTRGRIEGPQGAAKLLDINPHTLRARMRGLGIDWARFREGAQR
jgi:DNA-binding NtrC family response regulator